MRTPSMRKTHLPRDHEWTLCGKQQVLVQMHPRNQIVDLATCQTCQRADDVKQVRDYRAECRKAGIDPDSYQRVRHVH